MSWSAKQYSTFEDERTRPVRDLLSAVPAREANRVADLGCGPGNSTEVLSARFPGAAVVGLDSSVDMIEAARSRLPQFKFVQGAIETWAPVERFDVILSNAALQWVPDHATLFPRLTDKLASGGSLAIQMPDNLDEPAHRLMREIAADGPWRDKLASAAQTRTTLESVNWYYQLLQSCSSRVDVWRTTYYHALAGGADAVVEWFKGSGLRPFLAPLDDAQQATFLGRYRAAIAEAYPALSDGTVLLPFPRLFMIATR